VLGYISCPFVTLFRSNASVMRICLHTTYAVEIDEATERECIPTDDVLRIVYTSLLATLPDLRSLLPRMRVFQERPAGRETLLSLRLLLRLHNQVVAPYSFRAGKSIPA